METNSQHETGEHSGASPCSQIFNATNERNQMTITKEQQAEMLEAAKPLIAWLNENCHPHCKAHVDQNTIELTEGIATNRTDEYLRD